MRRIKVFIIITAVLLLTAAGPAEAMFLTRDSMPRAGGMAGVMTALGNDVSAVYFNPAGLAGIYSDEVYAVYGNRFTGLDSSVNLMSGNAAGVYGITDRFGIGMGIMSFTATDLYSEGEAIMRGGYEVGDGISVGAGIRLLWLSYAEDDYTPLNEIFDGGLGTTGISFDIGARLVRDRFVYGLSVSDINSPDMGLKHTDRVPLTLRAGVGYTPNIITRIGGDFNLRGGEFDVSLGAERYIQNFALRAGFGAGSSSYLNATAGFGHEWKNLNIDYSFSYPLSGLRNHYGTHEIGIGYRFGPSRRMELYESREYYNAAVRALGDGRFAEASAFASRALVTEINITQDESRFLEQIIKLSRHLSSADIGDELVQRAVIAGAYEYSRQDLREAVMKFAYAFSRTEDSGLREMIRMIERESGISLADEGIVLTWNLAEQFIEEGMNRIRQRRFDDAIREFERVLTLEPENLDALRRLGTAYYMLGRTSQAERVWRRVLEIDPNDERVLEMLRGLE